MPGEAKIKVRPLKPVGAKYATKEIGLARELAKNLLYQALFYSQKSNLEFHGTAGCRLNGYVTVPGLDAPDCIYPIGAEEVRFKNPE